MTEPTAAPITSRTVQDLLDADRRDPDAAVYGGGVSSEPQHAHLRSSVRTLSTLLGESLARHEGAELLELVERVRRLAREPESTELQRVLAEVDDATAVVLARAFRLLSARQHHRAATPVA